MKSANLAVAILAASALTACDTMKPVHVFNPFAPPLRCAAESCDVDVMVQAGPDGCTIAPVPDLDVSQGPDTRKLTWTMKSPGYEFSSENWKYGIYVENATPGAFKNAQVTGDGKSLTIQFTKAGAPPKIKYTLTVRSSAGSKPFCEKLDPWLIL